MTPRLFGMPLGHKAQQVPKARKDPLVRQVLEERRGQQVPLVLQGRLMRLDHRDRPGQRDRKARVGANQYTCVAMAVPPGSLIYFTQGNGFGSLQAIPQPVNVIALPCSGVYQLQFVPGPGWTDPYPTPMINFASFPIGLPNYNTGGRSYNKFNLGVCDDNGQRRELQSHHHLIAVGKAG
jgi:hypothetical protein